MFSEDVGRPMHFIAGGLGPESNSTTSGNLPVQNGVVRGAGWADRANPIPVHGFSQDGLTSPGPIAINATNNNEAFGFHPGIVLGMICDGSVQVLNENVTMQQYSEFVTRNGREVNSYKF